MRLIFIGDVVGELGMRALEEYVPKLNQKYQPQIIIANGENASGGRGISEKLFKQMKRIGIDVVTLGNHAWADRDIYHFIDQESSIIRPANYPVDSEVPGRGYVIKQVNQSKLAVVNLSGRSFMGNLDDPFRKGHELITEIRKITPNIMIDFHAESTSEKEAMAWEFDGLVSALIGTHTHVQTNDERILPKGTAYQTDVGMTGFSQGILGMDKEPIIDNFKTQLPTRFTVPKSGSYRLNACYIELDEKTGRAKKIQSIRIDPDRPLFNW